MSDEEVESRNDIDNDDTLCLSFNLSCMTELLVPVDAERGDDGTMNAAPLLRFLLLKACTTWHCCFSAMIATRNASTRCLVVRLLLPILEVAISPFSIIAFSMLLLLI